MLAPEERENAQKLLKQPMEFPQEFKEWTRDFLAVNMPWIPISQILGYRDSRVRYDVVNTIEEVTSAFAPERQWNDLVETPAITGLADGTYWIAWGGMMYEAGGVGNCDPLRIGISINDATPTEWVTFWGNADQGYPGSRAGVYTLSNNDNNKVDQQYWWSLNAGATFGFRDRWIATLRIT